jgi:hypothetical protein
MSREDSVLDVAGLVLDATALSEALLDGDLQESRFRADAIAGNAYRLGMSAVHTAALAVVNRLGSDGDPPKNGYAKAVHDLSLELDDAMGRLQC